MLSDKLSTFLSEETRVIDFHKMAEVTAQGTQKRRILDECDTVLLRDCNNYPGYVLGVPHSYPI